MSDKPLKRKLDLSQDPVVMKATADIRRYRVLESTYYLRIAAEVLKLKAHLGSAVETREVDAWLQSEAGLTPVEIKSLSEFDLDLAYSPVLAESGTSPDVIAAIAKADEKTRSECLARIERGEQVDSSWIARATNDRYLASMHADDLARLRRSQMFEEAAESYAAAQLRQIEKGAGELLDLVAAASPDLDDIYSYSPNGEVDMTLAVNELSANLLTRLDEVFGGRPRVYEKSPDTDPLSYQASAKHVALASASLSYEVLRDIQRGRIRPDDLAQEWHVARRCLEFLAGRRSYSVSDRNAGGLRWSPAVSPTFIDLDAGAGGAALGFVAAGMHPLLVLARSSHELDAIASNPMRNVRLLEQDLAAQLASLKGHELDLITSGMPWHCYEFPEAKAAYKNSIAAVRDLEPKAFIFETLPPERDGYMAADFDNAGYDVQWFSLDSAEYGLAQTKKRDVMVGARKGSGILDHVVLPVLAGRQQSLAETIGDLVDTYYRKGDEPEGERDAHRILVEEWLERCGQQTVPAFPNPFQKRLAPEWRKRGIDISRFVRHPPTLEDLRREKGFFLSTNMVKRIQGFPPEWDVEQAKNSVARKVASSFPPIMAKMVGLSINTALTGVEFDHEKAFRVPLMRARPSKAQPGQSLYYYTPPVSEFYADPNRPLKRLDADNRRRSDVPRQPERERPPYRSSLAKAEDPNPSSEGMETEV